MTIKINQRLFVWLLLGFCVLAIPVGLLGKQAASHAEADGSDSSFTTRFVDHLQVIRLSGMIQDEEEQKSFLLSSSDGSASSVLKQLRKALKNEHVKGILLRINSPGGTVSASQEVCSAVEALRKSGRPVVVSMGDLAASGGYYISSAAQKIYAEPGTLTGSIGVIMNMMNFKGLIDKVGIQPEVIKSGQFKDIASATRPMTPEERAILQALVMDSYDQFVNAVATGRKIPVDQVKKIADGRVYSGRQALKIKLVDELGGYDEALDGLQKITMEQLHVTEKLPVDDKTSEGFLSMFLDSSSASLLKPFSAQSGANLLGQFLPESMSPRYAKVPLWMMQ